MKKALAILMVLAMVAGAAFAADPYGNMAAVAVEGDATLTWGYNFDGPARNGFKNEANWKISIPLIAKQTFTTKSEGDNYAEISIVDAQYNIVGEDGAGKDKFEGGDKKIDKVTAKLVFGNVYVDIYGAPSFKVNNAEIWKTIKNDGYFDDGKEGKLNRFEPGFDGVGTKVGYKAEKFDVGAKVASKLAYDNFGAGTAVNPDERKSEYAFGVDASVTPSDMISASATFNYANWNMVNAMNSDGTKPLKGIISTGFKATVKPIADLEIIAALDAGNDYYDTLDNNVTTPKPEQHWAFDAIATAKYKFVEGGLYYSSVGTTGTMFDGLNGTKPSLTDPTADVQNPAGTLSAYLKVTDGDFVENLDAAFTVMAYRFNDTVWVYKDPEAAPADLELVKGATPIAASLTASYKIVMNDVNYFKPGFEFFAQNRYDAATKSYDDLNKTGFALAYNVYGEYGLFTNTTVTAKYAKGATQDNFHDGLVKVASRTTDGVFTLACKIKY